MPQNGKKHIKNHIEKFLEFYKENKVLREVQIANIKAYITRRLRKKRKRTQSPRLRAQTRATSGSGSVLMPQRR